MIPPLEEEFRWGSIHLVLMFHNSSGELTDVLIKGMKQSRNEDLLELASFFFGVLNMPTQFKNGSVMRMTAGARKVFEDCLRDTEIEALQRGLAIKFPAA